MTNNRLELLAKAQEMLPQLVAWRRAFHEWPELGYQEVKTASRVAEVLQGLGASVTTEVARTGVVGVLDSGRPGPTVALRADMDALPITEATGLPFASKNPGVMHACGHDGHMAAVLGAGALLAATMEAWRGRVKLLFQPAEEMLGGAKVMCDEGVLENPRVDSIYGLHLWPWLPKGEVGLIEGPMMAAFDEFEIEIHGRSSHGASPHMGVDAIVIAARVVEALQHLVARESDPQDPLVVTVGQIEGGRATNIIADRVRLAGSVRTFDPALRASVRDRMEAIVAGVCTAHQATYGFTWRDGYPALVTDPWAVERYKEAVTEVMGEQAVAQGLRPSMASEDFAYYLQRVPGAYAFVGIAESDDTPGLHTPEFGFNEEILVDAAAMLAAVAITALEKHT